MHENNGYAARRFVNAKPLSDGNRDAFVYGILANYPHAISQETMCVYYEEHFKYREEVEVYDG